MVYGALAMVQVMVGVTVTEGTSPADSELEMYMSKATEFIYQTLGLSTSLSPVPDIIDSISEFYASGLYLARNNLPEGATEHPNVIRAKSLLKDYKDSLKPKSR